MYIFDFPGAYLIAEFPEENSSYKKFHGGFVDFICKVNPEHMNNVRVENNIKVLYLRLLQALYGCMESALLWHDLCTKTLKLHGFLVNPYKRCASNSTIGNK